MNILSRTENTNIKKMIYNYIRHTTYIRLIDMVMVIKVSKY